MTRNDIDEIRIDITVREENALSMQLCRDGTVGRRGSGAVPALPIVVTGMSAGEWFNQLVDNLDERVFSYGGIYDLPDKAGEPVTYKIAFLGRPGSDERNLCGFQFNTGSAARAENSLLPYFDDFIVRAVQLTEAWYQEFLVKHSAHGHPM